MRESTVINWLNDEISTFLSNSSLVSLSTPDEHVGLAQERDSNSQVYPFVGIQQIASRPHSAGIGSGELSVDFHSYDSNDLLTAIDYRRDVTLRLSVIPTTDNDAQLRDDLGEDLTDHLALVARKKDHPTDIDGMHVEEATSQNQSEDFVWADGIPVEIEYERYITDNDPAVAETVNIDIDVTDDLDTSSSSDAFSE